MNVLIEEIESGLPCKGKLVIHKTTGAACDSPIFYEGSKCGVKKKFHFSSYGLVPPNYKQFKGLHNFGSCGSAGSTDDIEVVAKAISGLNAKKRVGLCDGFVIKSLIEAKYDVEQVDGGFR